MVVDAAESTCESGDVDVARVDNVEVEVVGPDVVAVVAVVDVARLVDGGLGGGGTYAVSTKSGLSPRCTSLIKSL